MPGEGTGPDFIEAPARESDVVHVAHVAASRIFAPAVQVGTRFPASQTSLERLTGHHLPLLRAVGEIGADASLVESVPQVARMPRT